MEPGAADAPAAVAVVRDFVNTDDHELGTDELETVEGFSRWLAQAGLAEGADRGDLRGAGPRRASCERACAVPSSSTTTVRRGSLPTLGEALAELPVTLTWNGVAPVLTTDAEGALGGLARVAVSAHEAVASGDWSRLKICAFDECEWAYYDHSKNRSRAYCEYGCGNKLKTRAYRARQRAAGA